MCVTCVNQSLNETPATCFFFDHCFLRGNDKRPCDMPFNSRTDIRQIDQGPMEIFDETLRKKE